jgi:hypothetical protein
VWLRNFRLKRSTTILIKAWFCEQYRNVLHENYDFLRRYFLRNNVTCLMRDVAYIKQKILSVCKLSFNWENAIQYIRRITEPTFSLSHAVSRTDFYSLAKRNFLSRNLICLYDACVQLFRAKIFAFRVESGLYKYYLHYAKIQRIKYWFISTSETTSGHISLYKKGFLFLSEKKTGENFNDFNTVRSRTTCLYLLTYHCHILSPVSWLLNGYCSTLINS